MAKVLIKKETIDPYFDNVSLLLPFDNNFQDFSKNNLTLTVNGNAQISQAVSKLGGGSAFFDGDGDFLQTNSITLGSDNFTLESWIYLTTYGSANNPIFNQGNTDTTGAFLVLIGSAENDRYLIFYANNYERFRGTTIIPLNTWTHIAVSRQSNIYYFFINGILEGVHAGVYDHTQLPFKIGDGYGGVRYFDGYIDSLRVTEGVARYTSNFRPSIDFFGKLNIKRGGVDQFFNNVSLLLPMDTSFNDFSSNNFTVAVNGNAQISNAESKFGGGSALFDGNGDYLELPSSQAFDFGNGDFTIELWHYSTTSPSFETLLARWGSTQIFFLGGGIGFNYQFYVNGFLTVNGGTYVPNQWNHVAVSRNGSNLRMFINGQQVGSTYNIGATSFTTSNTVNLRIGADYNTNPYFQGYIDDLRITKGVARYTSNFTPSDLSGKSRKLNIYKSIQ